MKQEIGFKAGLEIHQQLNGQKLFCSCQSINSDEESNISTLRKLRAVVGESGLIDSAAAHEMSKAKQFRYLGNDEDCCLVELDEEPPHSINKYHLHTAIMICELLHAEIVDEIQVMRKIVVDGSNVSGFQRTMLVGRNGYIETQKGRVNIPTILLEEEAAQKLEDKEKEKLYKLDRLGIGLLEISTDASLKDALHIKEVAEYLGMVLRSTDRIKRGLGTIRQDVNVSIARGNRVEIKGFQDVRSIVKAVEKEIKRQQELIKEGGEVPKEVRKAEPDFTTSFLRPMPGASRLYPETDCLPIKTSHLVKEVEVPELLTEKILGIEKKFNISEVLAKEIVKEKINLEEYTKKFKEITPELIAHTLLIIPKDLKTRLKKDPKNITTKDFEEVLDKLNKKQISKDALTDILALKAEKRSVDYEQFKIADDKAIGEVVKKIVQEKPGLTPGGYMGLIMKELQGKVDGKKAMELLKKFTQ